jgi:pimeloyl-ACP methyl ester carboxylesterase
MRAEAQRLREQGIDGDHHFNYSFRAMALDQIETMRHLGHEHFLVGAHDRGARVAHRLCLDFRKSVKKVCLMEIAPALTMYRQTSQEFATKYMWWFFLITPPGKITKVLANRGWSVLAHVSVSI